MMYYTTFDDDLPHEFQTLDDIKKIENPKNVKSIGIYDGSYKNIDKDIFSDLIEIQKIEICNSFIKVLDKDIFKHNINLELISLDDIDLGSLDENIFKYNIKLKKLFLENCNLIKLHKNIFNTLENLEILSLYENSLEKLDKNLFSNLTKLHHLDLSYNELVSLPDNIFKYNTKLKELELHNNLLTPLSVNIFKNLTSLIKLNLSYNNLTLLPKNIFSNLIKLEELSMTNIKLSSLPEDLFKNLTQLRSLYLNNNNLTTLDKDLFQNLTQLQYLCLNNNKLTNIPSFIIELKHLILFTYHNNEIEYIPPHIQRFLNRLTNKSDKLQVYNDGQNIHNHNIQECIKTSLENILEYPKEYNEDELLQDLINSNMSSRSKQLLLEYCQDNSIHSVLNINFQEALFHVLEYINLELPNHKEEILKILETEILDSECKCFTGRISRLINCLNGFSPLVKVEIPQNMGLSNVIIMIKNKYEGDNLDELKSIVEKELLERGYEQEKINEYLDYIEI
jgi:Leucine-rich repeat (LRR) protein